MTNLTANIPNATNDILALLEHAESLPKFTTYGCYPIFYMDQQNSVLCAECANNNDEIDPIIVAHDCNWEDADLYCDNCGDRIESAYAEDERE